MIFVKENIQHFDEGGKLPRHENDDQAKCYGCDFKKYEMTHLNLILIPIPLKSIQSVKQITFKN